MKTYKSKKYADNEKLYVNFQNKPEKFKKEIR